MKFEKLNKNQKRNKIIISSVIGVLFIIGGIVLLKTYGFYEEKKSFNLLKGRIPDFGYDIKMLSLVVDGEKTETIPERGKFKVQVECINGKGIWNYKSWSLELTEFQKNTKCNIQFTSDDEINIEDENISGGIEKRQLHSASAGWNEWTADQSYGTIWLFMGATTTSSGGASISVNLTNFDENNPMNLSEELFIRSNQSSSYDSGFGNMGGLYKISNVKVGDVVHYYCNRTPGNNGIYYFGDFDFEDITESIFHDTKSGVKQYTLPPLDRAIIFYANFGASSYGSIDHLFTNTEATFMHYSAFRTSGESTTRNQDIYFMQNVKSGNQITINWYTNPIIKIYHY